MRARRFIEEWHGHERIVPTIAPHAPYTCTDAIYHEAAALCRRYGVPLVTHLSETTREVDESRAEREATPIAYAHRVGAFDVRCITAHCVHATEDDILLYARAPGRRGALPGSNLKLASGVNLPTLHPGRAARRPRPGNGPASNDDQDMFAEIHHQRPCCPRAPAATRRPSRRARRSPSPPPAARYPPRSPGRLAHARPPRRSDRGRARPPALGAALQLR